MSDSLAALRRDTVRKVRQVGVVQTVRHGARKLMGRFRSDFSPRSGSSLDWFDAKYGTDTAGIIRVGALDIPDAHLEHSNRYEAVVPEMFDAIMGMLPIRHEDFLFVDVGSGKGRALMLASRLPFKGVVGVEISVALTEIASNNIRIFGEQDRRCHAIRAVCSDATLYELPQENMVLYMNNPFDAETMGALISKVEKSLQEVPRKMFVAYHPPLHRALWDESSAFRVMCNTDRCVIYGSR